MAKTNEKRDVAAREAEKAADLLLPEPAEGEETEDEAAAA